MKFSVFILKRLLLSILVLLGLSILIFIIARVVPGDPVRAALGARVPKEVVERMRHEMYLDKTLSEQYIYWVKGILSGNFGHSLVTKRLVLEDIRDYFPATAELAIVGGILTVTFSIFLGGISGQYKDTWVDNLIRILSYSGVGIPAFVVAIIFVLLFGYYWRIFPIMSRLSPGMIYPTKITGLLTVDSLIQGNFVIFWDALKHLILPSVSLALGRICQEARVTRSSMISNMRKDFISAERGYGIPEKIITFKYLLKPSLIPTASLMGLEFANLIANAFLAELIFAWPGISRYGINAMLQKDLNAISAVIIVFGFIFVVVNIITDIVVGLLDPRIRLSRSRSA